MIKQTVKKLTPRWLLSLYHYVMALLAAARYGWPSEQLKVIGVTGTSGKTTTSYLITQLLELAGQSVGLTSTAVFKVADQEWLNNRKMTMLGRGETHRLLRQMVRTGCRYAVIESSSEGVAQFRHVGIHYDTLVFTNLTPEHLESHGGFANYKAAKLKLFQRLAASKPKRLGGQTIPRTIVANLDSEHVADFLQPVVERKITFTTNASIKNVSPQPLVAERIVVNKLGINFMVAGVAFSAPLLGDFNVSNLLAAISVLTTEGYTLVQLAALTPKLKPCPGRLELIATGQPYTVIVDYAFEPNALKGLYRVVEQFKQPGGRVIQLLGSAGGGRDQKPRPIKGELAATHADIVIVTNEDPYDEDPTEIINQVAMGAKGKGKIEGKNLFKILDRREAIAQAVSLARAGDIVLITGKGCEQAMAVANGKLLPWDDRTVVREEVTRLGGSS
ncbi:MAG: UDP-N-acetylmuramyl-tripeptide synthetase [Patescibacteria group bacterium]